MALPPTTQTLREGTTDSWTDRKRYLWLIGLVIPSAVVVIYTGYVLTGSGAWFWAGPILILGIVPVIDLCRALQRHGITNDRFDRVG